MRGESSLVAPVARAVAWARTAQMGPFVMLKRLVVIGVALSAVPFALAWLITQNVLHPKPRREDHVPNDFKLETEEVLFHSRDGIRLGGWFIAPPAGVETPAPGFVLSHGWARSRAELLPHADILHRAGYAVLMFDYRNRGTSEGDAVTLGLREQDDLVGALDYFEQRSEVDSSRIGVFGMSTGSVVAICVAARDQRIRMIAAECPFATQAAVLRRGLRHYSKLPPYGLVNIAEWLLERRVGMSLSRGDAARVVDRISPRPAFIMADENDAVIGSDQTVAVFEAAREPKQFWLIPGADHARGWQAAPEEYERRVLDFVRRTLPGGTLATSDEAYTSG